MEFLDTPLVIKKESIKRFTRAKPANQVNEEEEECSELSLDFMSESVSQRTI